jgi:hypothetical protein
MLGLLYASLKANDPGDPVDSILLAKMYIVL